MDNWKPRYRQKEKFWIRSQRKKVFFTADRHLEERRREQSLKTNETLCFSHSDRGLAQIRHVHHSLLWHRYCEKQKWVISQSVSLPPALAPLESKCF